MIVRYLDPYSVTLSVTGLGCVCFRVLGQSVKERRDEGFYPRLKAAVLSCSRG